MSFQDLPDDWPEHPITDPAIFIDVVDLMATVADREAGAIYVLVCYPSGPLTRMAITTWPNPLWHRRTYSNPSPGEP